MKKSQRLQEGRSRVRLMVTTSLWAGRFPLPLVLCNFGVQERRFGTVEICHRGEVRDAKVPNTARVQVVLAPRNPICPALLQEAVTSDSILLTARSESQLHSPS